MPPLKSLESEYPTFNSTFQHFCASHEIYSVEDFLLHDVYVLVGYAEGQSNSNELKEGITQLLAIVDSMHQPWLNGVELLEDARRNKHVLSTGCEGIDSLLQGGLKEGQLTELAGVSSSGKTQICLQAAAHVAHKYMATVMFLDTCNSFSSKRIACYINRLLDPSLRQDKYKSLERMMSNIVCHSVFDIFALLDVLHQLEVKLQSQVTAVTGKLRLLIIDSFSSLITPILGGQGAHVWIRFLLEVEFLKAGTEMYHVKRTHMPMLFVCTCVPRVMIKSGSSRFFILFGFQLFLECKSSYNEKILIIPGHFFKYGHSPFVNNQLLSDK